MKPTPNAKAHRRKLRARKLAGTAGAELDAARRKQLQRRARLLAEIRGK